MKVRAAAIQELVAQEDDVSVQNDVYTHLAELAGNEVGKEVHVLSGDIAAQMGVTGEAVSKTFFNLNRHHKIEVLRGENGRSIIGFKLLQLPGEPRPSQRAPRMVERERQGEPVKVEAGMPTPARRRSLLTPNLDAYAETKAKFATMTASLGDLVTATFNDNAYAEEGIAVLGRLRSIEDQYTELRRRCDEQERDLKALRLLQEEKVRIKAGAAGVMVQQGD